jgi:alkylresorcinol/alkylpyrone synthase
MSLSLHCRLHANCGVDFRNFVLPLDAYPKLGRLQRPPTTPGSPPPSNSARPPSTRALDPLGLTAADISAIFFASVTGIASPTIDARLINRMPFPPTSSARPSSASAASPEPPASRAPPTTSAPSPTRSPCCSRSSSARSPGRMTTSPSPTSSPAASSATARRRRHRRRRSTLPNPPSPPASSPPAPPSIATPSTSWAGTSATPASRSSSPPTSPKSSPTTCAATSTASSPSNNLTLADISSWIFHSGGPKVLEATETASNCPKTPSPSHGRASRGRQSLRRLRPHASSKTPRQEHPAPPGTYSILAAMGPGFCLELVLLRW